jgi:hypothetical protein
LQMRRAVSRSMVMSVGSSSYCGKTAHSASTLQHCQSASKHSPARRCHPSNQPARHLPWASYGSRARWTSLLRASQSVT